MSVQFDTRAYTDTLVASRRISLEDATVHCEALKGALGEQSDGLMTKSEGELIRTDFKAEIQEFREEMRAEFKVLKWMGGSLWALILLTLIAPAMKIGLGIMGMTP